MTTPEFEVGDRVLGGARIWKVRGTIPVAATAPRWIQKRTFTAYLAAHNLREKPVLCLPEHLIGEHDG